MARKHEFEWVTRAECLDAFADSYGEYPPTGEVPAWWNAFEKWFQEQREKAGKNLVAMTLRTETRPYEDDEEDEPEEDDDPEPESEPEPT
jgi:hypothetical protein